MRTCPSILEYKAEDYLRQVERLSPYFQYFQIDIADGILVDNKTAPLDEIIDEIKKDGSRLDQKITFDFHLMVKDYETEIKKLEALKNVITIKNILVHFSVVNNFAFDVLSFSPFPVGIVLNPEEKVETLADKFSLQNIPFLQIMSVVPGAQGNSFISKTLNKIEQLRLLDYRKEVFLDGAVNDQTIPLINSLKFKPDFVCPGSYLTKSEGEELKKRVEYLKQYEN